MLTITEQQQTKIAALLQPPLKAESFILTLLLKSPNIKSTLHTDTMSSRGTMCVQMQQTQFVQRDFLQILQLDFSLPRGEGAAFFPAQYL